MGDFSPIGTSFDISNSAKSPYQVTLVEGKKYFWSQCGLSKKQPFCDGRYKTTSFQPVQFVADETSSEVFLCGCKRTSTPLFCDGSHVSEEVQSALIS
ncbi:CDGSH iron-sulfur domain-containing protein 3, mitochondrial-like [Montipora capricornis]|uniref:CDGSH iron-sulfur domain-containing protein 3, mitochondrial-like n=1 Tax=Montipora capricornis TaxID=246305 RepID=UPI0035F19AB6